MQQARRLRLYPRSKTGAAELFFRHTYGSSVLRRYPDYGFCSCAPRNHRNQPNATLVCNRTTPQKIQLVVGSLEISGKTWRKVFRPSMGPACPSSGARIVARAAIIPTEPTTCASIDTNNVCCLGSVCISARPFPMPISKSNTPRYSQRERLRTEERNGE